MYAANLKVGNNYKGLRKTISSIIIGKEIEQFKGILKSHTKWQLQEEHQNVILTGFCELHIIKCPKQFRSMKATEKMKCYSR